MKTAPSLLIAFLSMLAVSVTARAQTITGPNIFTGAITSTNATPQYGTLPSSVVDQTTTALIFNESAPTSAGQEQDLSISGFTAPITSLVFYSVPLDGYRSSPSVTIYSDDSGYTGFTPAAYGNYVGTYTLTYAEPTGATDGGLPIGATTINGLVLPDGTNSLFFNFAYSGATYNDGANLYGSRISEIQAFGPVAETPEPSTYALILLGVGSLLLFRKVRASKLS